MKQLLTIWLMCFCLLFLTGVNFVIYSPDSNSHSSIKAVADDEGSPIEEKSSAKTGLTVQEEYIHEFHIANHSYITLLSTHFHLSSEKLETVHFDLIAPPPKA